MHGSTHRPGWKTLLAFAIIYFVWGSTFYAIRAQAKLTQRFRWVSNSSSSLQLVQSAAASCGKSILFESVPSEVESLGRVNPSAAFSIHSRRRFEYLEVISTPVAWLPSYARLNPSPAASTAARTVFSSRKL
jgi:hypothetical protein